MAHFTAIFSHSLIWPEERPVETQSGAFEWAPYTWQFCVVSTIWVKVSDMAVRDGVVCIVTRSTAHLVLGSYPAMGTCEGFEVRGRLYRRKELENGSETFLHLHGIAPIQAVSTTTENSGEANSCLLYLSFKYKINGGERTLVEYVKTRDQVRKRGSRWQDNIKLI